MVRVSKIKYNPNISVEDNAKNNNVTIEGVRYFIKTRGINRGNQSKINRINAISNLIKKNKKISKYKIAKISGISINTVRKYYPIAVDVANGRCNIENLYSTISVDKEKKIEFDKKLEKIIGLCKELGVNYTLKSTTSLKCDDVIEIDDMKIYKACNKKSKYLYLLKDSNYPDVMKIGISSTPNIRERTLLSNAPSVYLFKYVECDNASKIETLLHKRYTKQRVRGEWFKLSEKQEKKLFKEFDWIDAV